MDQIFQGTSILRKKNRQKILNCIRLYHPISRTEIVKKVKLSKATVTRIVEELISQEIVEEIGIGDSSSGRKPVYLKIKSNAYVCVGVNISPKKVRVSIVDLEQNILERKAFDMKDQTQSDEFSEFTNQLGNTVDELLILQKVSSQRVLGIGIGVPLLFYEGSSKEEKKNVFSLKEQQKLKQYLQERFNLPVFIDKNPNTRLLGEYWYGFAKECKNFMYIACGEGIGLGILLEGQVIRGNNKIAGELGHLKVYPNGELCNCGQEGCLEAYSSTDAIEQSYLKQTGKAMEYQKICTQAALGEQVAKEIIHKALCILATEISNLIHLLNPEKIVFSGELLEYEAFVFKDLVNLISEKTLEDFLCNTKFYHRKFESGLYEIGAAALVYKDFFG